MYPTHDLDGCYFPAQMPTDEEMRAYEAHQRQSGEWCLAGLCMECGAGGTLHAGYCSSCMNDLYEDSIRTPKDEC